MSEMINFGIDLGTTNSLVAKFNKGTVEVFKDPRHHGIEVLPSVVGFRDDRILVGQQARTYAERDWKNVVSRFKRKMAQGFLSFQAQVPHLARKECGPQI